MSETYLRSKARKAVERHFFDWAYLDCSESHLALGDKRANPMAVKAALTYDINEAANALGKTPATIRSWIKDGLPVMSSRKPYLISGEAIRSYLRAKYKASKRPLGPDDFFCPGCGGARKPVEMAATTWPMQNKSVLLKGVCSGCG